MSNPANLRIYNFILPEGNVKLKGLGTKEKEFVVSEIEFGEGNFTEKQKQALAIIKPEAVLTEDDLKNCLTLCDSTPSSLVKVADDVKTTLLENNK